MEKTIEELIEQLNDGDEFVVEDAIANLQMRSDESFDLLLEALKNRKKNIRLNAIKVLAMSDNDDIINPLIEVLHDNNKLVRREASTVLSRMDNAVDPLIEILNDEDWKVRGAAAWALGNLKNEKAIEPLKKLLDDESGFVKSGASNAIATIEKDV